MDSMNLVIANGRLVASAKGVIALVPFSVSGSITGDTKALDLTLTATNLRVGTLLTQVFGSSMVPDFLLGLVNPMMFTSVTLMYTSNSTTKFAIAATPDINSAPTLRTIIAAIGLQPADLQLRMGPSALTFGVTKTWVIDLPNPFTGPGSVTLAFELDAKTRAAVLSGAFSSAIRIPGVSSVRQIPSVHAVCVCVCVCWRVRACAYVCLRNTYLARDFK